MGGWVGGRGLLVADAVAWGEEGIHPGSLEQSNEEGEEEHDDLGAWMEWGGWVGEWVGWTE